MFWCTYYLPHKVNAQCALWEHFTSASNTELRIHLVDHNRQTECTCNPIAAAGIDGEGAEWI